MKLLGAHPSQIDIGELIDQQVQGDYIYAYPPRQAYRQLTAIGSLDERVAQSLGTRQDAPINLYLHFPFCRQICRFCNLYAVRSRDETFYESYVDRIISEMHAWSKATGSRSVDTIYLGGGTPSLLSVPLIDRVLSAFEGLWSTGRETVSEISLEVAPDTVDPDRLKALAATGVTRVNLGLQSANDSELAGVGRSHGYDRAKTAIEAALGSGFNDVCVDLIYGLPNQSIGDWCRSIEEVVRLGPSTVCAYPLTVRKGTAFGTGRTLVSGSEQYKKYEYARDTLQHVGYAQETHVRYVKPGVGGYKQKVNHWASQDIIGIGAGARGYLRHVDYRNGYSLRRRRTALDRYMGGEAGQFAIDSGFIMNDNERARKAIILGLIHLDRKGFTQQYGCDPLMLFSQEFGKLVDLGLVTVGESHVTLTTDGRKYRDLAVQLFFSDDVWSRVADFDYLE